LVELKTSNQGAFKKNFKFIEINKKNVNKMETGLINRNSKNVI